MKSRDHHSSGWQGFLTWKINASSQVENAPAELSDMCRVIAQIHSKHSYLLTAVEE